MEERSQERRKHVFAINASPPFLNIIRELFQEEGYNVTTTNFAPNSFAQIEALQPDALIIDIAIGQEAGWELLEQLVRMPIPPASRHLWSRPIPGCWPMLRRMLPATARTAFWKSHSIWKRCWEPFRR